MKYLKIIFLLLFVLNSCVPRKDIAYFQNIENLANTSLVDSKFVTIQPKDLLSIVVSSSNIEAARPFNLIAESRPPIGNNVAFNNQGNLQQQPYLVSNDGMIDFPVLGKIDVNGLTIDQLNHKLVGLLRNYITDAVVTIRLLNFQVSVLGEVSRPGTFQVNNENLSLLAALGLAGDLTIYGKRDNILVIRSVDGKKTYKYIDITDANFINTDYYYLKQNDIVYVEPNSAQRQSSKFNRNASVYVSVASLLVSVMVLLFR